MNWIFSSMVSCRFWPGSGSCSWLPITWRFASSAVCMCPRGAVKVVVKLTFNPAKAHVVRADITQYLRGEIVIRIEALELTLKVNAFQIKSFHAGSRGCIKLACDPGEVARRVQADGNLLRGGKAFCRVLVDDFSERRRGFRHYP